MERRMRVDDIRGFLSLDVSARAEERDRRGLDRVGHRIEPKIDGVEKNEQALPSLEPTEESKVRRLQLFRFHGDIAGQGIVKVLNHEVHS
mmetsp:Transcript_37069/g.77494  ORF Transcript_37069/g.77494 Transcript_37069/m.77494 type:complete len:90 (+) Transcript_37069:1692-1961(+)